jgi:acid phosphatase
MHRLAQRTGFTWAILGSLALPCPAAQAFGPPPLKHILVIVMENKSYNQVRAAPAFAGMIAEGSSFSDYHAITHPSQPNYIALWSGGTQGVANNDCPARGSPFSAGNLGRACEAAGLTWRSYAEELPAPGSAVCKASAGVPGQEYARKHAPWTDFSNLDHRNERPFTDLARDIAAGRLPNLAFVIPDLCHDMHGCAVAEGDAWLAKNLPPMLSAVGPKGIVVLTFDEDDGGSANRILTVIAGEPVRKGYVSTRTVSHYTLLRTICDALGLPPMGAAGRESPISDIWIGSDAVPSGAAVPPAAPAGPMLRELAEPPTAPTRPVHAQPEGTSPGG